jgi:hypothetical protein
MFVATGKLKDVGINTLLDAYLEALQDPEFMKSYKKWKKAQKPTRQEDTK